MSKLTKKQKTQVGKIDSNKLHGLTDALAVRRLVCCQCGGPIAFGNFSTPQPFKICRSIGRSIECHRERIEPWL